MRISKHLVDLINNLLSIGVNLTSSQRNYLAWRTSEEGKKYFKQQEENAFYDALAKGDTAVVDVGIKEKQDMINKLKRELGLLAVLVLLLVPGCATQIPLPVTSTPNALKTDEHTYTFKDNAIKTEQGVEILKGQWSVVSDDFMKDHVRNQNDLIAALDREKRQRTTLGVLSALFVGLVGYATLMTVIVMVKRRKKDG